MESVKSHAHDVHFDELGEASLKQYLAQKAYSKIFVLTDTNTKQHCLPLFSGILDRDIDAVFEIKPGEEHKTIPTCSEVWEMLSNYGGDRRSLLINLGGGVVTDLGGFVASTFKRGIDFINVPTTLLAMVDASIGGKTGVDLGPLKNQVGVINQPEMVLIFPRFLNTLEDRQVFSGYAEMLKHGLIKDERYWEDLRSLKNFETLGHIKKSIAIKNEIVLQDPAEKGLRKILNFGHTLGHAIESYFLAASEKEMLLHGEAIAIGMILEGYLSHRLTGLSKVELQEIKTTFLAVFKKVHFTKTDIENILSLLKYDKKNSYGNINFVLLQRIGKGVFDIKVKDHLFEEAFAYYSEL
ncbi:MAG: 3-dehydroquinate synthase [Bacteroidota bacterium]